MFGFLRRSGRAIPEIEASDAIEMSRTGSLVLVDVREDGEVKETGRAKGALHIPLGALKKYADPESPHHMQELGAAPAIAVYCVVGGRAENAAKMLRQMGYEEVYNLVGLKQWRAAGGELEG